MSEAPRSFTATIGLTTFGGVSEECERYASAWRAGQRPRIEEFLAGIGADDREVMLRELLALEVALRREAGEWPSWEEYSRRFPAESDALFAAFQAGTGAATDADDSPVSHLPRTEPIPGTPIAGNGVPSRISRYAILRLIGQGGFGRVYLVRDDDLHRDVAIKLPRPEALCTPRLVALFLKEARLAAGLKHPAIVTVHDIGRQEDGTLFVVLEYVEGGTLWDLLQSERLPVLRAVDLMIELADAVQHAHKQGLVHRDLKPSNILIDGEGRPHVTDFGLAIHEEGLRSFPGEVVGTPAYMAPEQVRGETHRLDVRTDIWSLGVILYEMLAGRLPFVGNRSQAFDAILNQPPRAPRQIDESIPRELERIVLNCLTKRMTDRYASSSELAEDLRLWRAERAEVEAPATAGIAALPRPGPAPSTSTEPTGIEVMPRGLRSFDVRDADFFLDLLPGPRDRDGLPAGLRFWKDRIEEVDPDKTFCVGLIYGPSGCGKSSLMKAGLLPRLAGPVLPVFVEATPADTEARLLASLRRRCPDLSHALTLPETLAALREGRTGPDERKVLIVIDQFEQWLHARFSQAGPEPDLIRALCQCDGGRVQALVLVRDDFWMAITRFFRDLEVRLIEGDNSAPVDLFDPAHARKVLSEFGRSFGRLPPRPAPLTPDQARFLDQAIGELQRGSDKVIPVRLSLFVEMVREKPWTPATLRHVGGADGLGVVLLEETFGASTAPPAHRAHQAAARGVLQALLPEAGTDIKGQMRSGRELRDAAGYAGREVEFAELIRILDTELRLVTPTDPEGLDPDSASRETVLPGETFYQLTHDDLVPSIRQWLTRKQSETRRGRAEIRLAERAALWNVRYDRRQLPSPWEFLDAWVRTRHDGWSAAERKLMKAATRFFSARFALLAVTLMGLTIAGFEGYGRFQAEALCNRLLAARTAEVPGLIDVLAPYRRWADPMLEAEVRSRPESQHRPLLNARLALLPVDQSQVVWLVEGMLNSEPDEFVMIRTALRPHADSLIGELWWEALDPEGDRDRRFRAGGALAMFDPENERWNVLAPDIVARLGKEEPFRLIQWIEAFRPVQRMLVPPLRTVFHDPQRPEARYVAACVLAEYLAGDPEALLELALSADPRQLGALLPRLRPFGDRLADPLDAVLRADEMIRRKACAGALLVAIGHGAHVWPLLRSSPDPRLRTRLIHQFGPARVDFRTLIEHLGVERDPSIRFALLLGLGEYDPDEVPPADREALARSLYRIFRDDHDAGIHSASGWLIQRWGRDENVRAVIPSLVSRGCRAGFGWYVNRQGHTMSVIRGPVESVTGEGPSSCRAIIPRSFALATREVTRAQIRRSRGIARPESEDDRPADGISYYDAVRYCRWLSEQEGIAENQMCYPPLDRIGPGMEPVPNFLKRKGYRLPTEAEWEFACRAGTATDRYPGDELEMLGHYAWTALNASERTWSVGQLKPNDLGFFDILGNVSEWCQGRAIEPGPISMTPPKVLGTEDDHVVTDDRPMLRGGAFDSAFKSVRASVLNGNEPALQSLSVGFRVARTED